MTDQDKAFEKLLNKCGLKKGEVEYGNFAYMDCGGRFISNGNESADWFALNHRKGDRYWKWNGEKYQPCLLLFGRRSAKLNKMLKRS